MMLMLLARHRRLLIIIACILAVVLPIILAILFFMSDTGSGIKSATIDVQRGKTPSVFSLGNKRNFTYSSPVIKSKFEFDAIAPHWKEQKASDSNRTVSVRTSADGHDWSGWMKLEVMRPQKDNAPHEDEVFPETPLISVGNYFQYKVNLTATSPDNAPSIRNMNITYIDSRPTLQQQVKDVLRHAFSTNAGATSAMPRVISRSGWGNPDPTGDNFKGTDQYWQPSYQHVSQVFVHHTVDSNYTSQVDGGSVVRAIWQYHTYTLGWGDIGYNYLVDEAGNIYEGRAHGDNVVGGHVYGYNVGSMGVALVGCFQPNDSACQQLNNGNTQPPSGAMFNSLTDLLSWKMTTYSVDPQATHSFCKYDGSACIGLYTISGHRDAYPTSCPGDLAYQELQSIRSATASKMANKYSYAAEQTTFPTVDLGDKNETSVTMQFRNVGTATWYSSGANPIRLATANFDDHNSTFQGSGWLSGNRAATLNEPSVAPGQLGSFTFIIANPPDYTGTWTEYFRLVADGLTGFGNFFGLPITTRSYAFAFNNQHTYTDSTKTTELPLDNLSPGQTAWLTLSLTNTGNTTWYNAGTHPVHLGASGPTDRSSGLCTSGWINCSRPASLQQASVAPGQTGTFEFPIHIPAANGTFMEYFSPVVEGSAWMNGPSVYWGLTIHGNYAWSFAGQHVYTDSSKSAEADTNSLSPGQTIFFSIQAKNTGNATWYNSGTYPLDLATSRPFDRISTFYNGAWLSYNRPARLKESSVSPGQIGTFETTYTIPRGGQYQEYMQPVAEGITWLNDVGLYLPATVNGVYNWSYAGQQAYTDSSMTTLMNPAAATPGQRFYFVVSAKNTGNATWYNSGNYPLLLGTSHPQDRQGVLYDSSWLSNNRPALLTESSVAPGQVGHFGAYYKAPSTPGTYQEYLQPLAESLVWLNDAGLYVPVTVK